ncbi:hypothetical protein Tco_0623593, partial [Tanacetum coccineum]
GEMLGSACQAGCQALAFGMMTIPVGQSPFLRRLLAMSGRRPVMSICGVRSMSPASLSSGTEGPTHMRTLYNVV